MNTSRQYTRLRVVPLSQIRCVIRTMQRQYFYSLDQNQIKPDLGPKSDEYNTYNQMYTDPKTLKNQR